MKSGPRLRLAWTIHLTWVAWRRRRLAIGVGLATFAVATAALFICGVYWGQAAHRSQSREESGTAELVAFLRDDLPRSSRDALSAVLGQLPGVARVRALGSDEVLSRMKIELGERASVLDGVEEGFLPATLELTLQTSATAADVATSAERADAIAWRLRRMDGITDVDVLRSGEDRQLAQAQREGRRLARWGLVLALGTAVLALCLAGVMFRRRSSDARLLAGLGFTVAAVAAPGAVVGAGCALGGAGLATGVAVLLKHAVGAWGAGTVFAPDSQLALRLPSNGGGTFVLGVVALLVACGAALGWWGARPSAREVDDLGSSS